MRFAKSIWALLGTKWRSTTSLNRAGLEIDFWLLWLKFKVDREMRQGTESASMAIFIFFRAQHCLEAQMILLDRLHAKCAKAREMR